MKLTLLGTGLPMPNPARMGPSQVISQGELYLLVDCGPGAIHRLRQSQIMLHAINMHGLLALEDNAENYGRVLLDRDPGTFTI